MRDRVYLRYNKLIINNEIYKTTDLEQGKILKIFNLYK